MEKKVIKLLFVLLLVCLPVMARAEAFPSFPMSFYGKASLNGVALPKGTRIQAYSNNNLVGDVVMADNGFYGYIASTKSKLVVGEYDGGNLQFKYLPSGTIQPLTGDTVVTYSGVFVSGDVRELDINFTKNSSVLDSGAGSISVTPADVTTTTIMVSNAVVNPKVDLSSLATTTNNKKEAMLPSRMEIKAATSIGRIEVALPANTVISGAMTWSGIINAPTVKENSSVSVTADSGKTATVSSVIEVGFDDVKLVLSSAARIVIVGQSGKEAGYSRGGVFTKISSTCSSDSQSSGDSLSSEGDCKIDSGGDLVIWTKHFTKFVSYAQQTSVSGGSGGGGGGSASTPLASQNIIVATTTATIAVTATSTQENKTDIKGIATSTDKIDFEIVKSTATETKEKAQQEIKGVKIYFDKEKSLAKKDEKMVNRVKGMILLQVEEQGQSWYVNPKDGKKYFLGRPADAFAVMRKLGLGVKHNVITNNKFGTNLLGKILIDTEDKGKAYYINPKDKKAYFLGRPADAFAVMRKLALGISNKDIRKVEVGE